MPFDPISTHSNATPSLNSEPQWTPPKVLELFQKGLIELLWEAQHIHRQHHPADEVELATLLSIKTGGCPENCSYCPQSQHFETGIQNEPLLDLETVRQAAQRARAQGARRFCMGAAWRSPTEKQLDEVITMIQEVKALGLETCVTLGMLKQGQAERLKAAGLDFYNHNLDTSEDFYPEIISTRHFADRLKTIQAVHDAQLNSCVGGIIGLGESVEQRAHLIATLANLNPYPQSVPINQLVPHPGTPLAEQAPPHPFELVRTIAVVRICMPKAMVRLSAGRTELQDSTQALCFLAGANSIFYGDTLLTTPNPSQDHDLQLLNALGLQPRQ
ncbi:MAG TPA: biotin synthase BioB [Paenalcaligenes sp.]|nr:biotin synthase BioB [Paenalcaligenes sp.]